MKRIVGYMAFVIAAGLWTWAMTRDLTLAICMGGVVALMGIGIRFTWARRAVVFTFSLLLCASTVSAQTIKKSDFFKPFGASAIISTSVCSAGQMSDVISSTGYEGNSFLRGSDGRMNRSKAIPLKLGLCFAPLAFESRVSRKVRIFLRITQIGIGALGFYDAAKNWKVNR